MAHLNLLKRMEHGYPLLQTPALNKVDAFRKVAKVSILADELAALKMCFAIKDQEELRRQRLLAKQFVEQLRLLKKSEQE